MLELERALVQLALGVRQIEQLVTRIGNSFEFYRDRFNPDYIDEVEAGLNDLYRMFDVPPVPRLRKHDGTSRITVTATGWVDQFNELSDLLVPGSGEAVTRQGEAIRMAGNLSREISGNGGINWNRKFRRMSDTLIALLSSDATATDIDELATLGAEIGTGEASYETMQRIKELAVEWVLAHPDPVPTIEGP